VGWNLEPIGVVLVRMPTIVSVSDETRFTVSQTSQTVYYGAVFKAKKEIPT